MQKLHWYMQHIYSIILAEEEKTTLALHSG